LACDGEQANVKGLGILFTERTIMTSLKTSHKTEARFLKPPHSRSSSDCLRCGGAGYLKSSPVTYHTCLLCLGRGVKPVHKEASVPSALLE